MDNRSVEFAKLSIRIVSRVQILIEMLYGKYFVITFAKYIPETSVLLDLGAAWVSFQKYQGCQEVCDGLESRLRKKSFWIFDLSTPGLFNDVAP